MALSDISEIASDIQYVPLQTIDSSLISRIDKVVIQGENIYVNNWGNYRDTKRKTIKSLKNIIYSIDREPNFIE